HEVLEIISMFPEVSRKSFEEIRVRWRIAPAKIVYGVYDPTAEEVAPHTIDYCFREIRVRRDHSPQRQPWIPLFVICDALPVKKSGFLQLLGTRIPDDPECQRGRAHVGEVDFMTLWVIKEHLVFRPGRVRHPAKECSDTPKLVLRPGVERVVVALRAIQPP